MENPIGDKTEYKEVRNHLWRHQSRNNPYYSKEYIDTTKCFESMFNSRASVYSNNSGPSIQSNEQFMMITTTHFMHT